MTDNGVGNTYAKNQVNNTILYQKVFREKKTIINHYFKYYNKTKFYLIKDNGCRRTKNIILAQESGEIEVLRNRRKPLFQ